MMLTRRHFTAGLLAAPAIARAAAPPAKIRIGVAMAGLGGRPYSLGSALSVVHVQGLLEREFAAQGTAIEWHFFAGQGPAVNEALANNALDFAWQGDLPEIVARSRGLQTTQLLVAGNRTPVFVAAATAAPISSLADLKGKTVANFQGTNLQLSADRILATVGLTEQDLQIVNLDQVTAIQAVATHQIDASFLQLGIMPVFASRVKLIFHAGDDAPQLTPQASFITTAAFGQAYPDAVDRVVRVVVGAAHWSSQESNRAALYEIYGKTGYPPALIASMYDQRDLKTANSPLWDPFETSQLSRSAADTYKYGLIRGPISTQGWIDSGPLTRALAATGLSSYWPRYAADGVTKLS